MRPAVQFLDGANNILSYTDDYEPKFITHTLELRTELAKSNTVKAAARMGLGQAWPHFECKLTPLEQKLMMSCPRSVKQLQA